MKYDNVKHNTETTRCIIAKISSLFCPFKENKPPNKNHSPNEKPILLPITISDFLVPKIYVKGYAKAPTHNASDTPLATRAKEEEVN